MDRHATYTAWTPGNDVDRMALIPKELRPTCDVFALGVPKNTDLHRSSRLRNPSSCLSAVSSWFQMYARSFPWAREHVADHDVHATPGRSTPKPITRYCESSALACRVILVEVIWSRNGVGGPKPSAMALNICSTSSAKPRSGRRRLRRFSDLPRLLRHR